MNKVAELNSKEDAYRLLESLGASEKLILHLQLVGEAAEDLIRCVHALGLAFDEDLVRIGTAVHDAGKLLHPGELSGGGNEHELAGEKLLLLSGIRPEIARCCVSHACYGSMPVCFEELLVALADNLWKGRRAEELELRVIDEAARILGLERWDIFVELDSCFEKIASQGTQRLARSMSSR